MDDKNVGKDIPKANKKDRFSGLINTKPQEMNVSLLDPMVFSKLLSFASVGRDNNLKLNLQYKANTISYLGKKKFSDSDQTMNIPYGFSKDGKDLAYHEFGTALAKYDENTVQLIARIVLRLMRSASRNEAKPEDIVKTHELFKQLPTDKQGDYSAIELVGQLLTASASETGRAPTGYLNNYATLHRLRHKPADKLMSNLLKEIFPPNQKIPNEIKLPYGKKKEDEEHKKNRLARLEEIEDAMKKDKDKLDKTRHATAFSGSQHAMRVLSGLEELKQYNDNGEGNIKHWNWKNKFNAERYEEMSNRDDDYVIKAVSKKDLKNEEKTEERRKRKIEDHYKAAVNYEINGYYEKNHNPDYYADRISNSSNIDELILALKELKIRLEEFSDNKFKGSFLIDVANAGIVSGPPKVLNLCKSIKELKNYLKVLPKDSIIPNSKGDIINVNAIAKSLPDEIEKIKNGTITKSFGLRNLVMRLKEVDLEKTQHTNNKLSDEGLMQMQDNDEKHNTKAKRKHEDDGEFYKKSKHDDQKDEMDEDISKDVLNDKINVLIDDDVMLSDEEEKIEELKKLEKEILSKFNAIKMTINPNIRSTYENIPNRKKFKEFEKLFNSYKKSQAHSDFKDYDKISKFINDINGKIDALDSKEQKNPSINTINKKP